MTRKHRQRVLAVWVVAGLVFCLVLQYLAATDLQRRHARIVSPVLNENTLLRLQNIPRLTGDCVLLGSSITERMPVTDHVSVIAIPGSSFTAGCILMDRHAHFPRETTYILEVNNLFSGNNWDVLRQTEKWDFYRLADNKFLSRAARPVNQIVSYVYLFSADTNAHMAENDCFDTPIEQPEELSAGAPTPEEMEEWSEVLQRMQELRAKGGKLCMVYYPSNDLKGFEESYKKAQKLAAYANVPLLNYNKAEWLPRVVLTDHHHMDHRAPETMRFRNTVVRDARKCAR